MKHLATLISEKVITDQETNLVSLVNLTEKIDVGITVKDKNEQPSHYNVPVSLNIMSIWHRDDSSSEEKFELKVVQLDSKQNELGSFENTVTFPQNSSRIRVRIKMKEIRVNESGTYTFVIKHKVNDQWKTVSKVPLEVEITFRDLSVN